MASYSDHVSVVDSAVAGPSKSRVTPSRRQPRKAAAPRRKAQPIPPEDIIEISDSDDEQPHARSVAATPNRRRTLGGGAQTGGTPDRHPRAPLFLPDDDNDSDDDILAILTAEDDLSNASPRVSLSPQDKGKRRADIRPPERYDSPLRLPIPLSAANTPPASHEDVLTANRIPRLMAQVLELVPDVDKSYLEKLIALQIDSRSVSSGSDWGDDDDLCAQVIDAVLHNLFENAEYPKRRERPSSHAQSSSSLAGGSSKAPLESAIRASEGNDSTTTGSRMGDALHSGEDAVVDGPHSVSTATAVGSGPSAPPPSEPIQDPVSRTVAQVLEIIPDVEPAYLRDLVQRQLTAHHVEPAESGAAAFDSYEVALQRTLHSLFEKPDYPKAARKRKRSSDEGAEEAGPAKTRKVEGPDYASKDRTRTGGKYYDEISLNQLSQDFPGVPYDQLHQRFAEHNRLYAPTYLSLRAERKEAVVGSDSKPRSSGRKRKGKGRARHDPEFDKERAWLLRKLQEEATLHGAEEDEGEGLECGCCFSSYPISKMTQCPDAHLFCVDCVTNYASTLLGEHNPAIGCMDQSGCKLLFPPSELRRILTPKLLELYERVTQRKELEAAGLENLEECPFCEYQVVIENDQEKLFRCEREECGAVSCRKCKKLDHLPKSCEEAAEDKKLDARHAIEEAMTAALMRNCPSCKKAFIKEAGCNKMVCPNCRTMSCYICRKIIHGYEHFNQAPPYNMPKDGSKCPLWDSDIERRHAEEVAAAAQKAQEEYKRAHPEVNEADIKVDLPKVPPPKRGVCNNPNHRHDLHHRHYVPVPHPAARPVAGPVMRAQDPLFRAMEAQRMAPPPHLGYDAQAAVAYAQGQPFLPFPIAPPMPMHPAHPVHPIHPVHPLPAALPYVPHPHHHHLPVAPAIPPAVAAPLRDVRRNPPRGVPMAQGIVQIMGNAGMLGPEGLNEGLRRPHRADRAHSRPVKVARHR